MLRALDESGVKIDVVVGSGVGTVAAAFAAAAGGPRLYGEGGFWDGAGWDALYRLRAGLRTAILLLACSFGVFLLPVALALLGGVLFLPLALADLALPGLTARLTAAISSVPGALRAPYLVALSLPIFVLCAFAFLALLRMALRDRRRIPELFEAVLDPTVGEVAAREGAVGDRARVRHLLVPDLGGGDRPQVRRPRRREPGAARLPRADPAHGRPRHRRRACRSCC